MPASHRWRQHVTVGLSTEAVRQHPGLRHGPAAFGRSRRQLLGLVARTLSTSCGNRHRPWWCAVSGGILRKLPVVIAGRAAHLRQLGLRRSPSHCRRGPLVCGRLCGWHGSLVGWVGSHWPIFGCSGSSNGGGCSLLPLEFLVEGAGARQCVSSIECVQLRSALSRTWNAGRISRASTTHAGRCRRTSAASGIIRNGWPAGHASARIAAHSSRIC